MIFKKGDAVYIFDASKSRMYDTIEGVRDGKLAHSVLYIVYDVNGDEENQYICLYPSLWWVGSGCLKLWKPRKARCFASSNIP